MLISVSGKINSGKDTIGKILQILLNNPHLNNEGVLSFLKKDINFDSPYYKTWQIKKFATIPTEIYKKITNIDFHSLSRADKELERPNFIDFINNKVKQVFGKDVWVKALMREYFCTHSDHAPNGIDCPNWIITDMRFLNEMEAVKKRGGITIRVNRPCDICGGSGYHKMSCPVSKSGEHLSETSLDSAEFDYVIDNNGTIEELIEKVREILIKEKLL